MKRHPHFDRRAARAVAVALSGWLGLALGPMAHAQQDLFLSGGEIADTAYYSYIGAIIPFGRHEGGHGWFQRYWLDAFGYEYDGAPGHVQADVIGGEAALGYGRSGARGWWNVSAGLRYTDTSLSPDDPTAHARGSQFGAKLQVEGEGQVAAAWRLGGIASYTSEQNGYWARVRLMRGPYTRAFGIEALANGNEEADATAVGFVTTFQPGAGSKWSIGLKAGYRFQQDADGAYGGLELGYAF